VAAMITRGVSGPNAPEKKAAGTNWNVIEEACPVWAAIPPPRQGPDSHGRSAD
jgi:hypothetical protein